MRAPVNGFVTNLTLDIGQYASVGTEVMALIDSDSYRVTGYFEETKLPLIKPEEQADIYLLDGAPPLGGHVQSSARGITDPDNPAVRTPGQCQSDIRVGSARAAHPGAYPHRSCTYGSAGQLGHDLYCRAQRRAAAMGDCRGAARMVSGSAMRM